MTGKKQKKAKKKLLLCLPALLRRHNAMSSSSDTLQHATTVVKTEEIGGLLTRASVQYGLTKQESRSEEIETDTIDAKYLQYLLAIFFNRTE